MKPKIAIVISHPIQHFCPQYAGLARSDQWELKVFFASTAGYKSYFDKNFGKQISWNNLEMEYSHLFLNDGREVAINDSIDAPELDRELDAFSPDTVMVYGYSKKYHRRAYNWALRNNKPIMYMSDSELRHKRNVLRNLVKKIYLPQYFNKVDLFFSVGNANEEYLQYYGADPLKFIRSSFPVNVEKFKAAYENRRSLGVSIREKHGIVADAIVLSVVGKLIDIKAHDKLIEAVKLLDGSDTKLSLLIIGSGPTENSLKKLAASVTGQQIIFTGFINVDELPAYYAATDIYVHPSHVEPHSLSISESMYMGCPQIISDKCGSWGATDDLRPGINGLVYRSESPQELAAAIARLAHNPGLREWFGSNSREIAVSSQKDIHEKSMQAALIRLGLLYT